MKSISLAVRDCLQELGEMGLLVFEELDLFFALGRLDLFAAEVALVELIDLRF